MRAPQAVGGPPMGVTAEHPRRGSLAHPLLAATLGLLAAVGLIAIIAASITLRLDLLAAGLGLIATVVALPGLAPAAARDREVATAAWREAAKRVTDVGLALAGLLLLLPLMTVIGLAVKLGDGGPVIYRQPRAGRGGELFPMYKFRSMRPAVDPCEPPAGIITKARDDDRITPVGRILRRSSLDELPQLVNVLLGHMSIVGPRPLPPCEVAVVPDWAADRFEVRPGLTCYWQVAGRSEIGWEERMELDARYVRERSLAVDARVIVRTFDAVVSGRGAY